MIYLMLNSTQRIVQDRIRITSRSICRLSLEVTDEVVAATGVAPGSPKFQRPRIR